MKMKNIFKLGFYSSIVFSFIPILLFPLPAHLHTIEIFVPCFYLMIFISSFVKENLFKISYSIFQMIFISSSIFLLSLILIEEFGKKIIKWGDNNSTYGFMAIGILICNLISLFFLYCYFYKGKDIRNTNFEKIYCIAMAIIYSLLLFYCDKEWFIYWLKS